MALNSILCWSGGKDSTASVILAHIHSIPIDKIIMSEVMFSHEENISGEDSEHIEWVYNVAKPMFESWGYDVEILRDKDDYLSLFFKKLTSKSKSEGKHCGFPIGGICQLNSRLKIRPIDKYIKQFCDIKTISYQGLAIDEPERLQNMKARKGNNVSLLEQYGYTELMALELCADYNLLSPLYLRKCNRRQGCWFCPNRTISQFAELYTRQPHLWQRLVELSKTPNLCSYGFKYGLTVQEVERKIHIELKQQELASRQISIENYMEDLTMSNYNNGFDAAQRDYELQTPWDKAVDNDDGGQPFESEIAEMSETVEVEG